MQWTNSPSAYGLIQIVLHWTSVLVVACMIPLGLWMTGLDYYDPWYKRAPDIHRAIGVLFGILLLVRMFARSLQTQPSALANNRLQVRAARWTHRLLYLLPTLLIISGYLVSTADGRAVDVFGLFSVPATLHGIDRQEDIAGEIHFWLAMSLIAVVTAHAGAALHHHFHRRDATLRRMLRPGIRSTQ